MLLRDAQGEPVTAADRRALDLFELAVDAYLGSRADALERARAAVAADPHCVLARCLLGYLRMLSSRRDGVNEAAALATHARQNAAGGLTSRERLHLLALDGWAAGDLRAAAHCWEALLAEHPRDVLALRISQFVLSYLGEGQRMRDATEGALRAWDERMPGYGYALGCHAYALEEVGEYAAAEAAGRRAVELNPADIWAAHAVVHVNEMQGRVRDGVAWVGALAKEWTGCGTFANHLCWHEALYHLELGEHDDALGIYDADVRAAASDEYLDLANAISLLWRMEQLDVDVGGRWLELAARAKRRLHDHVLVFADVHYAMALAAVLGDAAVEPFVDECERFAARDQGTESAVMRDVGIPLIRAAAAHRRRDYAEVVERLLPVRERVRLIGGSNAQRDLFSQMLIDAAWRGGRLGIAESLLAERVARRPRNVWAWAHRVAVQEASGQNADGARRQLERLRVEASS